MKLHRLAFKVHLLSSQSILFVFNIKSIEWMALDINYNERNDDQYIVITIGLNHRKDGIGL